LVVMTLTGAQTRAMASRNSARETRGCVMVTSLFSRITQIGDDKGVWPVAVKTDTVVYASAEPDPIRAWPGDPKHLGTGLGQFKVEGTGRLVDQLPYLNGKDWTDEAKALITGGAAAEGDE
ncbi:MAG: hypothetical protein AAGC63_06210, partial [Propionicimonas sp.]